MFRVAGETHIPGLRTRRNLWAAVMARALQDLKPSKGAHHHRAAPERIRAEAEAWFNHRGFEDVNTFDSVCLVLGWDPDVVRNRVWNNPREVWDRLRYFKTAPRRKRA